ncbi:hypothetical protein [Actinomyces oricola]|uniref:hypothetical protein n=1 Tax=Actinomyces oricola TaxID=206043 RepID=UPI000FFF4415|nr:hypothetical protein [Actinomyces oricola]
MISSIPRAALTLYAFVAPLVDASPVEPPGIAADVKTVLGYLMWGGGIACVVAIVTIGIIFILNATGRIGGGAEEIINRIGLVAIGAGLLGGATGIGYALTGV